MLERDINVVVCLLGVLGMGGGRICIPPTLKPATAISGAWRKNLGERVWIP